MTDKLVAYVGKLKNPDVSSVRHWLTDWHGNVIGSCVLTSAWRVYNSHIGTHMHQIRAKTTDGREWNGRGFGQGMVVNLKTTKR